MKNSVKQSYKYIPVGELVIDEYQRIIDSKKIKERSAGFDPLKLGTITVSKRKGKCYVIDGQHRTVLAKAKNIPGLMALVYEGLTYEDEARLFKSLNGANGETKRLSTTDIFNASVEAKEQEAIDLKNIVESIGFRIANYSGNNIICAIGNLEKLFAKKGAENIAETLSLIKQTWNGEAHSLHGKIIIGLSEFLTIYDQEPNFSRSVFVKQLAKVDPQKIMREANGDTSTNVTKVKMMNVLFKYYNVRLSKKLVNKHFA